MSEATQSAESDTPVIVRLDEVTPRKVLWLWKHRIPRGKLTLLAGDGGIGKSLLTMDLAQRISSGRPWPDSLCEPNPTGGVVIVSAEDDIDDTIVPRLKAAGADLARIVAIQGIEYTDQERKRRGVRGFNLQHDMPALEAAIDATDGCSLIIIDPVTAFMGKARGNDNVEVRGCLAPLAALAADTGVAIVLVSHLNKPGAAAATTAMHRVIGSIAFSAAARATWLVCRDEEQPQRRLMLPIKANLTADQTGLAYEVNASDDDPEIPVVHWQAGAVTVKADEALSGQRSESASVVQLAADFLADILADGPVHGPQVFTKAHSLGLSKRSIERAREKLPITIRPVIENGKRRWMWSLVRQIPLDREYGVVDVVGGVGGVQTTDEVRQVRQDRQQYHVRQEDQVDDSDAREREAIMAVEAEAERA